MTTAPEPILVVLISGTGRNLQAIIDAIAGGLVNARIAAVISDRADAYGLQRADEAGIATEVLLRKDFASRADHDRALAERIASHAPDLVILAGFMRVLSADCVARFHGRMVNIHPSLLPRYRGLHTHARALEAGEREHGASIHFVTEELDGGPVILQGRVAVRDDDTPETLAARVTNEVELRAYPLVVAWLAAGRVRLGSDGVYVDGRRLERPLQLDDCNEEAI